MANILKWVSVLSLIFLVGCPPPSNTELNTGEATLTPGVNISMSISSTGEKTNSIPISDAAKVDVVFLDEKTEPLANEIINLSATSGALTQTSVLTDNLGRATVTINSPSITSGTLPGVFTATSVLTGESSTFNYQFVAEDSVNSQVNLTMTITSTGIESNSIPVNDTATVDIVFLDATNAPLANEIINLSATSGALTQTSVLTSSLGQATVKINPPSITTGTFPGKFTATPEFTGEPVSFNYQFVAEDAVKPQVGLTMTITSKGVESNSIFVNDAAKVDIVFLDAANAPLANEIINLSATSGTLTQADVLTDSLGQATVTINPPSITTGTSPGVFTAIPEFTGEPTTLNYQFIATGVPDSAASLQFLSANPAFLSLKGTGGFGYGEQSSVAFKVVDEFGNPVSGVEVSFTLTTTVGGMALTESSVFSDSQGVATVVVLAGSVSTPVRVTASIEKDDGSILSIQSDVLTVTTGIPDQNSFSMAADKYAPESFSFNGNTVQLSIYLADRNNNPIPDGTVVNFTTEGGKIDGSCITTDSSCSVAWSSQNPRPLDHRVTILAYAIGNETFYDFNGSGIFDDGDVFVDLGEAFRDDDEMGTYNPGLINFSLDEKLIDYDENLAYTPGDGVFNGVPCNHSIDCPVDANNIVGRSNLLVNLRASTELIMASSNPNVHFYELLGGNTSCLDVNNKLVVDGVTCQVISQDFATGVDSKSFWVLIEDTAAFCLDSAGGNRIDRVYLPEDPACVFATRQSAPTGSSISVTSEVGSVTTIPSSVPNQLAAFEFTFTVTSAADNAEIVGGTVEIVVTTPQTGNIITRSASLLDPIN